MDITPLQEERLEELRRKWGIRFFLAFGSQVKGGTHPGSDLDIGVLLNHAADFRSELIGEIMEVFPGSDVDIALLNRADPLLLKEVSESHVLLCGDPAEVQEFRIYAFKRFQDYRPSFALEARTNQRHLKAL
jgi:predicted nucleotidyltransferase